MTNAERQVEALLTEVERLREEREWLKGLVLDVCHERDALRNNLARLQGRLRADGRL